MPLTAEDAAKQISDQIKQLGGWKPGNVLDAVIGVSVSNADELQAMLNDLLTKKGILSANDETAIKDLLAAQESARKKRNQIRTRNGIALGLVVVITGTIIYLSIKKKNKS